MKIENLKLKIVFFGSSKFVIPIIETLKKSFDLALVVTTENEPNASVPTYCKKHGINYISIDSFSDPTIRYRLKATRSSIGVLAYFGLILPPEILNLFPKGIINVHPSLLPKYRGPTPVQTAILNGDKETGVTIIKLDEEVDHGPILVQKNEPILLTDTAETLYERLFIKGGQLLPDCIQKYLDGEITPVKQNHVKATLTNRLSRTDGYIDISDIPSPKQLDRMIRAYYPWPGVYTKLKIKNEKLKIVKFLPQGRIQVEGRKQMSYKDFINGYPQLKEKIEKLGIH